MKKIIDIEELASLIAKHNHLYWNLQNPEIPDSEYDQLVEELRSFDSAHPILSFLGVQFDELGTKVTHSKPMLSLDKCYDEASLIKWASKFKSDFIVSPKIDGMACSLIYKSGCLQLASTRGDGSVGEDISANVVKLDSIPKKVKDLLDFEVRGELYMPLSSYELHKQAFSNPRNAVAGSLKQKDGGASYTANLGIKFFAYDLIGTNHLTLAQRFSVLQQVGFTVPPYQVLKDDLQKGYDKVAQERLSLDYELDGVVYRVNNVSEYEKAGYTSHHPKGALAYKFQGDEKITVLRGVEWQVSRNGILTPVGLVDPVPLSGAVVSRITLHNASMLKSKGLTLNAEVLACRRGGVIPHLERVIKDGDTAISLPSHCPQCGASTSLEGDFLYCTGKDTCLSALTQRISHFIDRMEIEGIGQSWVEKLVETKLVLSPVDLFRLDRAGLSKLVNMGDTRIDGWLSSIGKAKRVSLDKFLQSLGIEALGRKASDVLSSKFKTLESIRALTYAQIEILEGFGELMAKAIVDGLKANETLIDELLTFISIDNGAEREGKFKGLSFLFTGTLTMKRNDAEALVSNNGGNIASSVSKNLSYLVAGEKAGSKLDKANSLGVKVLTENEFLDLLKD